MGLDGQMRLQPVRRTILLGIGAGAAALWSVGLRGARAAAPDWSSGTTDHAPADAATAVLYEEDPGKPTGNRFAGETRWRVATSPDTMGGAAETVVRAHIAVPERGMVLEASFRRNRDRSLPASHTIELIFTLPAPFAHGEIDKVPGILMKERETARGTRLWCLSVKVIDRFFLIGLSAAVKDLASNMRLLHQLGWFDLPIVYSDQKRAILAFAKGAEGERAFGQAFAAWDAEAASPSPSDSVIGPEDK